MSDYQGIAAMIDHALLNPHLRQEEICQGCDLAVSLGVAAVCVRPSDVELACNILKNKKVLVTTVIGFPHGTTTALTKITEAKEAMDQGARELDVVLNIGRLKSGDYDYVQEELLAIIEPAHEQGVLVKVIFENCYLTDQEKIKACQIASNIGIDFVKTSTGFGSGGAKEEDVILMGKHISRNMQIKAAGGIRTLQQVEQFKRLGCTRIGTSATTTILNEVKNELNKRTDI